jgi:cobalt-zinc-cadmium efflux system outer membrane protein
MHAHWLVSLGIVLAVFTPVAAGETETSYRLKELRAVARSAHPTLESAEAAVEAAVGALQQAQAYPNPEVSLGFGRGRPRDGGDSRSEHTVALVQPIEMPGIRQWRARSAELRLSGAEIDRVLAGTIVDSTVSRLVYTILLERRRAEIARESADVASRLHELLARRVELGESSPLEAVKARSEWFGRRRDVVDAETALAAARSALNLFCGHRLPADYGIAETLEGPGAVALPGDLVDRLRTRNPVLLRAEIAIEEAEARTGVAKKEIFPRLEVFAGYEKELDRTANSVGVGMTIPLWNRNRGEIASAATEHVRATTEAHALALELETALGQASAAYRRALSAIRLHREGWTEAAEQSLDIATFSFENGEASLLDVLDSQRSYLDVSLAEAESWAALALARAEIERLVAGPLESERIDETR